MNITESAKAVLGVAKALILSGGIISGQNTASKEGAPVWYGSNRANTFSLMGAIKRATLDFGAVPQHHFTFHCILKEALRLLANGNETDQTQIMEASEYLSLTTEDAVAMLDAAIGAT